MLLEVTDIANQGVNQDQSDYMMPPEVWTSALNWLSRDGKMEVRKGRENVFGTPTVTPHFLMPIAGPSTHYWIYTSLTAAYVYDGSTHTVLTRTSGGAYTASETRQWNGTVLAGIPILNNGVDLPQFWGTLAPATKLANLTNFPATGRARIIRAFGAYLFALDYTEGSSVYPHLVKWSSSVPDPGTLPETWDPADETQDAGEYDLPDVNSGIIRDGMTLGNKLFIYKDNSTWAVRYIGGVPIFSFDTFSETSGILAPRCVAVTGDGKKHVVATQDDIIIHNGSGDPVSIVDKKMRSTIFANIDPTYYLNSFCYTDPENSEVVFAYPETGSTNPTRGLSFNYRNGALTEMNIGFRNAAVGKIEASSSEAWSTGSDTWAQDTGPWAQGGERRRTLVAATDESRIQRLNSTYRWNDVEYACILRRTGLSMLGRKRNGEWIVDHYIRKLITGVWPRVSQDQSGYWLRVRVGSQEDRDGDITWSDYDWYPQTPNVPKSDFTVSGRFMAVEFYVPVAAEVKLDGYKMNVHPLGAF